MQLRPIIQILSDAPPRFFTDDGGHRLLHLIRYNSTGKICLTYIHSVLIISKIFFPRSITHESGYQAKSNSPQTSKMPAVPPAIPQYNSRHLSAQKSPFTRHPPPELRMNSFRFPDNSPHHSLHLAHSRSDTPHRRDSDVSDLSRGYESDAESVVMAPHLAPFPTHPVPSQSMPTSMSVAPSDDTVWEREHELLQRRRHSDGPFFYNRQGHIVTTAAPWLPSAQEQGRLHPAPQLHPYVSILKITLTEEFLTSCVGD